jgi:AraC-like DNA-binding protein
MSDTLPQSYLTNRPTPDGGYRLDARLDTVEITPQTVGKACAEPVRRSSRGPTPANRSLSETWRQRVGGYAGLRKLIGALGVEPGAMLELAGLARNALDEADSTIPYAALGRLLLMSSARTGCPHLGLLSGRMWRLSDLGAVGTLVRTSATVGDALYALIEHQYLDSEGALSYVARHGATVDVGYAIYHPAVTGTAHIYDSFLAGTFNYLRELCGNEWTPSEVLIPHARPNIFAPYRTILRVIPRFNSEICALRFRADWMERRVEGACPERHRVAREQVDRVESSDLIQRVYRALRLLLLHERLGGDDVAHALAIHRRTLNRRLQSHGTTYQGILDDVRFSVARELLLLPELPLDDVASALGYAGMSSFTRTFQRWAGTTPGRWRRVTALEPCAVATF